MSGWNIRATKPSKYQISDLGVAYLEPSVFIKLPLNLDIKHSKHHTEPVIFLKHPLSMDNWTSNSPKLPIRTCCISKTLFKCGHQSSPKRPLKTGCISKNSFKPEHLSSPKGPLKTGCISKTSFKSEHQRSCNL